MPKIALSRITLDKRLQHRVAINEELSLELKEAYKAGEPVEAIDLIFDGATHWLPDGHTRYWACEAAGCTEIDANVYDGDYVAAFRWSLRANAKRGSRRSQADLWNVVEAVLGDDELCKLSNKDLAGIVNCSVTTIASHRRERDKLAEVKEKIDSLPPADIASDTPSEPQKPQVFADEDAAKAAKKRAAIKVKSTFYKFGNALNESGQFEDVSKQLSEIKTIVGIV